MCPAQRFISCVYCFARIPRIQGIYKLGEGETREIFPTDLFPSLASFSLLLFCSLIILAAAEPADTIPLHVPPRRLDHHRLRRHNSLHFTTSVAQTPIGAHVAARRGTAGHAKNKSQEAFTPLFYQKAWWHKRYEIVFVGRSAFSESEGIIVWPPSAFPLTYYVVCEAIKFS